MEKRRSSQPFTPQRKLQQRLGSRSRTPSHNPPSDRRKRWHNRNVPIGVETGVIQNA